MELRVLHLCLRQNHFPARDDLLLWVTDSTSAALSTKKGSCSSPHGRRELEAILSLCDQRGLEIIAFWVPLKDNVVAAHLSHLSAVLGKNAAGGNLPHLADAA